MRYFAPLVGLLLLSGAAVLEPATAQPNRAREGVQSGEVRSLDQILSGIRRERPGSLADVEGPFGGPDGEPHYRLKWLTPDGRVLMLDTDARTGRVLGVQGDDRPAPPGAGPGPGAEPRGQNPRAAQGARRNMNPPPSDQYDFSAPGIRPPRGGPGVRRPVPDQNFAPGQQPNFRERPEPRRGAQPPPDFRRGAPQRQRFEGGPPPQQRFDRGPSSPRGNFRSGGFGGGGGMDRGPRMPRGEPRNPRSFR